MVCRSVPSKYPVKFKQSTVNYKPVVAKHVADDMCLSAFGVLDRQDNGTVQTSELRHVVTALGDKLTEEEADHFIRDCEPDSSGVIKYNKLLTKINV